MAPLLPILLALAALAIGLGLGWLVGRGRAGAIAEERGKQCDALRVSLSEVGRERDEAVRELSGLQADARNFEARIKELMEAKEALSAQFHEVGAKLLSEAQKQFLERADARFNQASEKSEAQLKTLLQPVEATLKRYEEGLSKVEKERVGSYEALKEQVKLLHAGHMRSEEHTSELQSRLHLVCRLLLEKKKNNGKRARRVRGAAAVLLDPARLVPGNRPHHRRVRHLRRHLISGKSVKGRARHPTRSLPA